MWQAAMGTAPYAHSHDATSLDNERIRRRQHQLGAPRRPWYPIHMLWILDLWEDTQHHHPLCGIFPFQPGTGRNRLHASAVCHITICRWLGIDSGRRHRLAQESTYNDRER